MAKVEVKLKKTVYDSVKLSKQVDREFSTFVTPPPAEDLDTVSELFRLYDKLYFELPINGKTSSHEYLVTRSSELYTPPTETVEIQPLLDEIAQLREELLQANQEILKLTSQSI
jgi:hypothetical protein